jgi:hypothetical protein
MGRRTFLKILTALGVGILSFGRVMKSWAKGLPSDPDGQSGGAGGADVIILPPFEKTHAFTLEQALLLRKTSRSYDGNRALTREEISRLLWATSGANRPDGHRTVPSAVAKYPVDVLVALPEGVYRYDPRDHRLFRILADDIRGKIPNQDVFKKAAMHVLYVIVKERVPRGRTEFADVEIGCMGQALFLEAVALGMGSCIYASIRLEDVTKILGIKEDQILRLAQAVGPTQ